MHNWIILLILISVAFMISVIIVFGLYTFSKDSECELETEDDYLTLPDSDALNIIDIPKRRFRRKPWYERKRVRRKWGNIRMIKSLRQ